MNRSGGPGIRSIRYQIALPLLAIQTSVALAIAISGAWIASSRVEGEIHRDTAGQDDRRETGAENTVR